MDQKHKVLLVQPNFKIGWGNNIGYWLPYSVGCLWSYASQYDNITANFEISDIIFRRENPETLIKRNRKVDIAFFSCYMWNWEYNKHVAQELKRANPDILIVFGGPQVTNRPDEENFFDNHPYVDSISLNEGEVTFVTILETFLSRNKLEKVYQGGRLDDLEIPSPYLTGVFDKIMLENPGVLWNGTLETNRGCPFACTFCDWGSLTYAKIRKFPMHKVTNELVWMAKNKIEYVTIADANFGVFTDRDMEITELLVELQNTLDYPKVVDATWYKNSSDEILEIVKKFISSGFNRGLTLSVQSMDMDVLTEIRRRNMEISDLKMIFDKCNRENIPSYTELILGLPMETFNSWRRGICEVIEAGQHNAIESWLAQLLENAHMNHPAEREKHGLTTVIVENYVSGFEEEDNIAERVELVTGTKYMPREKFIDSWLYSWVVNNFHNFGWTQVITRLLRKYKNVQYIESYDMLFNAIKRDNGVVGKLFEDAKSKISYYLETGDSIGSSGHTLMWDAQKDFHKNYNDVLDFVRTTFNNEFCELEERLYNELIDFQTNYVTYVDQHYPYEKTFNFNFYEYINSIDDFRNSPQSYNFDIAEVVDSDDEYYGRLYFRRRQGWGKSVITPKK